jgi:hexosaminidase
MKWRDNDSKLKSILRQSPILSEVAPVSEAVSRLASIGLQALDYLDSGKRAPAAWLTEQRAFIATQRAGHAELLISIVPAIDQLVTRAGNGE